MRWAPRFVGYVVLYAGSFQPLGRKEVGRIGVGGIRSTLENPQVYPRLHSNWHARTSVHDEMVSYEVFRNVPGSHLDMLPSAHEYPG